LALLCDSPEIIFDIFNVYLNCFPKFPIKSRFPEHQMMFFLVKYDVPSHVTIAMPKVQ
jgi:hypothetical protein